MSIISQSLASNLSSLTLLMVKARFILDFAIFGEEESPVETRTAEYKQKNTEDDNLDIPCHQKGCVYNN